MSFRNNKINVIIAMIIIIMIIIESAREVKTQNRCWDKNTRRKQQASLIMRFEEIDQLILAKEGRLKR